MLGGVARGLAVAGLIALALALGLLAGNRSNKFDQFAAITKFVVTPPSFLSGSFYKPDSLPGRMGADSHANPVVYPIDGARLASPGRSDSDPLLGLAVATITLAALVRLWLRRGFRLNARAPGGAHL